MPTTWYIAYDVNGSDYFSRGDINKALHTLNLALASRGITTFRGPNAKNYRYKRLHMGVSSATEEFQHALTQALSGLEGVRNLVDGIIIHCKGRKQHDERLIKFCERMQEIGLNVKNECQELPI